MARAKTIQKANEVMTNFAESIGLELEDYKRIVGKPNVLILDIETRPIETRTWQTRKAFIPREMVHNPVIMLSYAAKWVGEKEVFYKDKSDSWDNFDDSEVTRSLVDLLDKADIVIAHNGKRFDVPIINTRAIVNNIEPPSYFRMDDSLIISSKGFRFTDNRLATITKELNVLEKLKHAKFPGYSLWDECLRGNPKAWAEMKKYNIQDVLSLEEAYLKMKPFDVSKNNIPVHGHGEENMMCPCCYGTNIIKKGIIKLNASAYQGYKCLDCGARPRGKKNLLALVTRETNKRKKSK